MDPSSFPHYYFAKYKAHKELADWKKQLSGGKNRPQSHFTSKNIVNWNEFNLIGLQKIVA